MQPQPAVYIVLTCNMDHEFMGYKLKCTGGDASMTWSAFGHSAQCHYSGTCVCQAQVATRRSKLVWRHQSHRHQTAQCATVPLRLTLRSASSTWEGCGEGREGGPQAVQCGRCLGGPASGHWEAGAAALSARSGRAAAGPARSPPTAPASCT